MRGREGDEGKKGRMSRRRGRKKEDLFYPE
jgi:hypothetical protein